MMVPAPKKPVAQADRTGPWQLTGSGTAGATSISLLAQVGRRGWLVRKYTGEGAAKGKAGLLWNKWG